MNLNEFLDEQEQVTNDGFEVDNEQKANWVLRKIKQMQDQIKNNNDLADSEINKIDQWRNQENEKAEQSIEYFQSLLAEYAMKKREENPKFKSLKLPNGIFGFRKKPVKWNYDDKALLSYLEQSNMHDLIRVTKAPNKAEIRRNFDVAGDKVINKETGEVVKGIEVLEQGETFNVRVE